MNKQTDYLECIEQFKFNWIHFLMSNIAINGLIMMEYYTSFESFLFMNFLSSMLSAVK